MRIRRRLAALLAAGLVSSSLLLAPAAASPLLADEAAAPPTADLAAAPDVADAPAAPPADGVADAAPAPPADVAAPDFTIAAANTARTTYHLPTISLGADPDIANPVRGVQAYLTPDTALVDGNTPFVDTYSRDNLFWYQLEPSEGVYDFSMLDHYLAMAQARGGKDGFRIIAADSTLPGHDAPFVPKYLWDRMPGAYTYTADGATVYMPDFDDPLFLTRARALIAAIGARYANDPRLGWVEAGFMGLWGEWHVTGAPRYSRGTLAHVAWTVDSGKQIIDAWRQSLPNTRLIAMTADFDVLDYALGKDPSIGWRHDCLGSTSLDALQQNPGYLNHQEQWKTAPIFWEACGPNTSVSLAHDQVIRYHFAAGHTIGGPTLANVSASDQALLKEYRKLAGYRFELEALNVPNRLVPGQPFSLTTTWSNLGLTPAYVPWRVRVQLRNAGGNVVWEAPSSVDLEHLLPTRDPSSGSNNPQTVTDQLQLAPNVPRGTYEVVLLIADPSGYYKPMALSNQGRGSDGSYRLGSVTVGG